MFELQGKRVFIPGRIRRHRRGDRARLRRGGARGDGGRASETKARRSPATSGAGAFGVSDGCERHGSIRAAVDEAAARMGGLDILVNCVGFNREQRIAEVTEATFDEIYRVNLRSAMFLAQAARATRSRAAAAASRCTCCRCARSSACAATATRRTAPPRARS
jgi:gluconate 5-dehydrogenase